MNEQQHFVPNDQCLDRGLLVSMRDGELPTDENVQALAHLIGCADCSADERDIQQNGQDVYSLLSTLNPSAMPDTNKAFATFQAKLRDEQHTANDLNIVPLSGQKAQKPLQPAWKRNRVRWITAAVAAALIAALLLPNAGVLASQFFALFHVQQFQPVKLDANQTTQDLFNNLTDFGTLKVSPTQITDLNNPTKAQVEQRTHFPLLQPSKLPQGVPTTPRYAFFNGTQATFTFDAAKARATMQRIGDSNVHIPAQLNGVAYTITVAPGVAIQYARVCNSDTSNKDASAACNNQRQLEVAEVPSPTVQGTSANSLTDLRAYMLSLPHLSLGIHELWQNVDLSTGTIPVPLPTAQTDAQRVSIHGAAGVLLVDNTIKYGGVLWQSHNIVYAIVTNTNDRTQILNTANSLG
jgi:hypothetical protein